MTHMYLFCSMAGSYWVPCEFIARNNLIDEVTIRYDDPFMGGIVEACVEGDRVKLLDSSKVVETNPQHIY